MADLNTLWKLEGLHTVETIAEELGITKQSALNLISRLKKEGHITAQGGGRLKRLYKVTIRKQLPREDGMFDILNRHSPMKLSQWFDHQVHGIYTEEDALVDAIQTGSFRAILASLRLFNHIRDWAKLYNLAKKKDCWQQVGALYDVARMFFKIRKMPEKYNMRKYTRLKYLIKKYKAKEKIFFPVKNKWKVEIPFRLGDIEKVKYDYT